MAPKAKTTTKKTTKSKSGDKRPTITYQTPFAEARWPNLTNPDTHGKYADGKFKVPLVFSDEDREAVEQVMRDAGASKEFQEYFREEGADLDDDTVELQIPHREFKNKETGEVEDIAIQFKSQRRPAIFDAKKNKLPAKLKIGNGTELRAGVALFPWVKKEKVKVKDAKTGKVTETEEMAYGVSGWLNSVQIRKLVKGGGSDGSEFEDVDGFEYDGSEDEDASDINGDADSDDDTSDDDADL